MNTAELFCQFTEKNLDSSDAATQYLKKRLWTPETAKLWRLGYFNEDKLIELKLFLKDNKCDPQNLEDDVYIFKNNKSFLYNRLIFPIFDPFGSAVATAGRCFDDSKPKYFNTKFEKSEHLFGLNLSKHAIRKQNCVYVFEGYADVITCFQNGIENVVCCMGVVFSEEHLSLLSHYCENIILVFDADAGGEKGRNLFNKKKLDTDNQYLWKDDSIKVKRVILDKHKDADEYIKNQGALALKEYFDACVSDEKLQKSLRGV